MIIHDRLYYRFGVEAISSVVCFIGKFVFKYLGECNIWSAYFMMVCLKQIVGIVLRPQDKSHVTSYYIDALVSRTPLCICSHGFISSFQYEVGRSKWEVVDMGKFWFSLYTN